MRGKDCDLQTYGLRVFRDVNETINVENKTRPIPIYRDLESETRRDVYQNLTES